jgi:excisionase family DNA binding protein
MTDPRVRADAPPPLAYRLTDAAARLKVHRITLWRWIRDGKLPSFKIGSTTFIPAEAFRPEMQSGCTEPRPYDALRYNQVANALSAAHSSGAETPRNTLPHVATRKRGSPRGTKGLG